MWNNILDGMRSLEIKEEVELTEKHTDRMIRTPVLGFKEMRDALKNRSTSAPPVVQNIKSNTGKHFSEELLHSIVLAMLSLFMKHCQREKKTPHQNDDDQGPQSPMMNTDGQTEGKKYHASAVVDEDQDGSEKDMREPPPSQRSSTNLILEQLRQQKRSCQKN